MAKVTIEHVSKIFRDDKGNTVRAVDDVCLEINDREFMVLVGPSGCGKSTMLRMVAGLEEITRGTIRIGDRVVNDVPPKDRDIAMVFQNYALYPHMTVHKNMAFGLHLRKHPKVEIESRVNDAADTLHIIELLYRKPKELSGGQRQRVAVGRAIVREPKVFLFDEPLSNLDAKMRGQMRTELSKLHTQLECTMIYVTHDQVEAMTMGDRVTVMNNGRIQQVDSPMDVYNQPANMFVAGFIGSPPMNFFQGALQQRDGHMVFCEKNAEGHQPFCVRVDSEHLEKLQKYLGQEVVMGIRPGDICDRLHRPDAEPARVVPSTVEVVEPLGPETYFYMNTGTHNYVARVPSSRKVPVNTRLEMVFDTRKAHFFDKQTTNTIV